MRIFQTVTVLLLALMAQWSMALPLPKVARSQVVLPAGFSADFDFEGIVDLSSCSGSLVRYEDSADTDFGLVLTNGHCVGRFIPPGQFIYGRPSNRTFGLFDGSGKVVADIQATELVYATMSKTDLAVYKLNQTYAELKRVHGVRPLTLSSAHAEIGQPMEVISGYWSRGYRCNVEAFPYSLKEGDWTWEDSIRYSRPGCEVIGGTSGSPVIAAGTRTVIGVNNTGNEYGERCTDNNPCEIDKDGDVSWEQGYSYGQQILWLYSCLNESREIDLALPGCELPH